MLETLADLQRKFYLEEIQIFVCEILLLIFFLLSFSLVINIYKTKKPQPTKLRLKMYILGGMIIDAETTRLTARLLWDYS